MNKEQSNINGICKFKFSLSILAISAAIIMLTACAEAPVQKQAEASKMDPYEDLNRSVSGFNDTVDGYVAKPISDAYKFITPQFVQTGVFNFFNNLKNVNVVINDVLQAKFSQSLQDTGRFAMNSTLGLAGFIDVAKKVGLEQNEEDFEQTLAVWGVPSGPYLVLPILGPTTIRGIPGAIFDTAANPATYVGAPVQLLSMLNARANAEGALKFINEAALDPYVFTRESFLQWRDSLAKDGATEVASDIDADLADDPAGDVSSSKESAKNKMSKSVAEKGAKPMLRLSAETDTDRVPHSFKDVAHSFEGTAKSFDSANEKLDKLKKK